MTATPPFTLDAQPRNPLQLNRRGILGRSKYRVFTNRVAIGRNTTSAHRSHPMNYGHSITATRAGHDEPGIFISGQAYQRGAVRPILPLKPKARLTEGEEPDFIPVWATAGDAAAIAARLQASPAVERFTFKAVDIRATIESGGVGSRHHGRFRGVDGWTIPPVPDSVRFARDPKDADPTTP